MTSPPVPSLPGPVHAVELAEIRADSLRFLETTAGRYGDVFAYRLAGDGGSGPSDRVVVVNHPDHVAVVLRSRAHAFTKERTPDHYMLAPLLGNGLLTSNGAAWQRQRTALAPLFRPREVQRFDEVMVAATQRLAGTWRDVAGVRAIDHELSALTLAILVESIFGSEVASVGQGFGRAVDSINHHIGRYGRAAVDADDQDARLSRAAYARAAGLVHGITDALVASVASAPDGDAILRRMRDAVTDDADLHDQVLTLVMAGHETTAKALGWTLALLALHPDVQDAVAAEVRDVAGDAPLTSGHAPALALTTAVVRETLRLYPPIWLMSRRSTEDVEFSGHLVPVGSLVCVSQWLVHRDPRWWPDPDAFRPDRFLTPSPERPAFAWFPFGGGERVCIGQHFALLESVLALGTLVRSCRFVTHENHDRTPPQPEALVTLRPAGGVRLEIRPRGRERPASGAGGWS